MQSVLQWWGGQASIMTLLQVLLDLMLVILVITLLARKPKALNTSRYEELTTFLEKIITDTKELASDFDANLQERRKLIQQITSQLDSRLDEARNVCKQLGNHRQVAEHTLHQEPAQRKIDHQEVLRLARKGHTAENIAGRLRKPLGEVELILNLSKLSGN